MRIGFAEEDGSNGFTRSEDPIVTKLRQQDKLLDLASQAIFRLMQENRQLKALLRRGGSRPARSEAPASQGNGQFVTAAPVPQGTPTDSASSPRTIEMNVTETSDGVAHAEPPASDPWYEGADGGGYGDLDSELGLND